MEHSYNRGASILYLIMVGVVFLLLTIVFMFFPRSKYSELEKRELATFPHPNKILDNPQKYTGEVSFWFGDTEPFRDVFMTISMGIRDLLRFRIGNEDEVVSYKPNLATSTEIGNEDIVPEAQGNPLADENAKVANAGIVVVGSGPKARALMAFGGAEKSTQPYIEVLNEYRKAFPTQQIYAVVIPTATEYYLPIKAEKASKSQKVPLDWLKANLGAGIKYVDVYAHLAGHTNEDIYLRTDHHWAPLGAYYAAKVLAKTAGVPFKELDSYDRHVIRNYVGSMYGYSKDITIKNAPEDFVYYTPKNAGENTTYIRYSTDKDYQIIAESAPYAGNFFHKFGDGSANAYLTFMGGDSNLVKVRTNVANNRKLLIIKDSFGNPVPSFLFYSFNEVHVVDFRYFKKNMKDYVRDNDITDIALVFNIFSACTPTSMAKVKTFLTQPNGIQKVAKETEKTEKQVKETHPDDAEVSSPTDADQYANPVSESQEGRP